MIKRILCYYIIFLISCFMHELGHIIMSKIFFDTTNHRIELGIGKSIIDLKKFAIKSIPIAGHGYWELEDLDRYNKSNKLRKIMPTLGGPLFSFAMTVLLIILYKENSEPNKFVNHMMIYSIVANASFFVSTILPIKYLDCSSDGMRILNILKSTENNVNQKKTPRGEECLLK
ncbi:MAG: M50 family metallopeptidase [Finegoldia magna]|nr:M50 family metallopeptidase [Finegoldia magna]